MTNTKVKSASAHRARYAVIGTLMHICFGGMYAWSYYKASIGSEFPIWNEKQLSLTFTIMMIAFSLGCLAGGRLAGRVRQRTLCLTSGILVCLAYQSVSLLPVVGDGMRLPMLYIFYGALTGFGTGIGYTTVLACVNGWFPDHSGLTSGILLTGYGFGSLILGKLAQGLMGSVGLYGALRTIGLICGVVIVVGAFLLKSNTDQPRTKAEASPIADTRDYTTGEMLRRPTFWLYFIWNLCMAATGMLVINNASTIAVFYGAAATVGLLLSIFNSGMRLLIGLSMDKLGWKITMFLDNIVIIAAGILMTVGGKTELFPVILIGMLLAGACYGGGITIQAALIRKFYGAKYYASNLSTCNLVAIPAAILGPMLSAYLVDAAGGTFGSTFIMVAVMGVLSLVINLFIRKP